MKPSGFSLLWMLIWLTSIALLCQITLVELTQHSVIVQSHIQAWEIRQQNPAPIQRVSVAEIPQQSLEHSSTKTKKGRTRTHKKGRE